MIQKTRQNEQALDQEQKGYEDEIESLQNTIEQN
jgi:hypothetical protein